MRNRQHWVLKSTGTRPRYKPQISSLTPRDSTSDFTILRHKVDVADSLVYLGSSVDAGGGNDSDIRRRIELARTFVRRRNGIIVRGKCGFCNFLTSVGGDYFCKCKQTTSIGWEWSSGSQTFLTSCYFRLWSHFYFRFYLSFRRDTYSSALPCA